MKCIRNEVEEKTKKLFEDNNGIVKLAQFMEVGISRDYVLKLYKDGFITRYKRGIYELNNSEPIDDIKILVNSISEAVLCLNSALFYYGYTDRTPMDWHIAVDRGINKEKLKISYPSIKVYYWKTEFYKIGIKAAQITSIDVKIYDRDKTICDVIRYSNKIDREIFNKAIDNYVKDNKKNINNLIKYAEELRISKKVKVFIGGRL